MIGFVLGKSRRRLEMAKATGDTQVAERRVQASRRDPSTTTYTCIKMVDDHTRLPEKTLTSQVSIPILLGRRKGKEKYR